LSKKGRAAQIFVKRKTQVGQIIGLGETALEKIIRGTLIEIKTQGVGLQPSG
jgi:hypothetical protein